MPDAASATPAGTDSGTDARATTASEGDADPNLPGAQRGRRGDEAELFEEFNRQLIRTIGRRVNTSQAIVEDACGYAWMQFMRYQPARDDGWKSWLLITAQREAWTLHRAEAGHVPLVSGRTSDDGRGGREPVW